MTDLLPRLLAQADIHPERPAILAPGTQVTFADLARGAAGFAARLQGRGYGNGDRVLVATGLSPALYIAILGSWMAGVTVVFPEPSLGLAGLIDARRRSGARGLISTGPWCLLAGLPAFWGCDLLVPSGVFSEGAADPAHLPPEPEIALISFTTGSTGRPKMIGRSPAFLTAQERALAPILEGEDGSRDLVGFPAFVLLNLAAGRSSILPGGPMAGRRFDPVRLKAWLAETGARRALLPPAAAGALLAQGLPETLHTVFTGGGPVRLDLLDALGREGRRAVGVYGSTEAEPIAVLEHRDITEEDRTAARTGGGLLAGGAAPGVDLRIEADEILVAGAHVNEGYLDTGGADPGKVTREGRIWHRTGDAGRIDDRGRLWLLGRWADQIGTAIAPFYPFQVEIPAEAWPGVRRAALLPREKPVLFLEGDRSKRGLYRERGRDLGLEDIRVISRIPMDRRHGSKIDRKSLRRMA